MTAPLLLYGTALRRAATGAAPRVEVLDPVGAILTQLDASAWVGDLIAGDESILDRCRGPVLDVGCGPGRLVGALHQRGDTALGVDISPEAVRQARRRGAPTVRASVFDPLPGEGRWRTVLLADGNIGIGGDPTRLLRRCLDLSGGTGSVLIEVLAPGEPTWTGEVTLRDADRVSTRFPWATVAADQTAAVAARAGLRVALEWKEADRWFAQICC